MTAQKLTTLLFSIEQKLKLAQALDRDSEVTRLRPLQLAAQQLQRSHGTLTAEFQRIQKELATGLMPTPSASTSQRTTVRLTWPTQSTSEEITATTAAGTLRSFLQRVVEVLGTESLARVAAVETGRGPLVSQNPGHDFNNRRRGSQYTNHPIGSSGWHVLTHSTTQEKADHLRKAFKILGLKDATVVVVETPDLTSAPDTATTPAGDTQI